MGYKIKQKHKGVNECLELYPMPLVRPSLQACLPSMQCSKKHAGRVEPESVLPCSLLGECARGRRPTVVKGLQHLDKYIHREGFWISNFRLNDLNALQHFFFY